MKKGLALCFLLVSVLLNAQDNIQWRGTDRTGIYKEEGLLKQWPAEGPKMNWHFDGLGDGHTSVAIDDDKIYLTGMQEKVGYLYVLDLSGKLLVKKEYGPEWSKNYDGPRGTVTVNEGKLYIMSGMGVLYCFNQKTLDVTWKKNILDEFDASNIVWGISEAPLIIGDKLIATPGGETHNVVALNKNTGELIWSCAGEGDKSAYCSPLYIKDQEVPQIVTITAKNVVGIDIENGKKLWSHKKTNMFAVHANTPVYGNNMILCTSGYGAGSIMLRLVEGGRNIELVWETKDLDNKIGGMVKVGDYAYGSGDRNRYWYCVDWKSGEIKYKEKGVAMGNIIANNDMLYIYTNKGEIILANATPDKFDIISRFPVTMGTSQHWAHPVIYKGKLFVRHGDSLMAYNLK